MGKEEDVKKFMIEQFVPALRRVLLANEKMRGLFVRHYGNCCNQTALLSCMHLTKELPTYLWEMYEGLFQIGEGRIIYFNHAWIYGINRMGLDKNLFLNLAEDGERITWEPVLENTYPEHCQHVWYAKEINRRPMNWETVSKACIAFNTGEYYTGWSAKRLYDAVMQEVIDNPDADMSWYAELVQARVNELRKRGFEI